jgi:hypothetical protein
MRLRQRSSGIFKSGKQPAKSPGARRHTCGEKPGVFALADLRLDLCAYALLVARDDRAERARGDRGHRSLLLLRWQVLH